MKFDSLEPDVQLDELPMLGSVLTNTTLVSILAE